VISKSTCRGVRMIFGSDCFTFTISLFIFARKFHVPEVFIGKALKGAAAAVVDLLQTVDNDANGCLRERTRGAFLLFSKIHKLQTVPYLLCFKFSLSL
jgi:hypothetical protein